MKILIISHEYPPVGGGGAGVCRAYAHRLAQRGHDVLVVTAGFGEQTGGVRSEGGKLRVMRLAAKRKSKDHSTFPEMLDYVRKASKYADKVLKNEQIDVCLTFFGIPGGVIARRLKKKYGLPYCIRFGGGDIPGFQDRFALIYRLVSHPLKRIWKDAGALVANSEGLKKTALEFCDSYPISVIENGVDVNRFTPVEAGQEPEPDDRGWNLLAVCRLVRRKGLQEVIARLGEMEQAAGCPVRLTIAGDGPYRSELEQFADKCSVSHRVHFTGLKDRSELPAIYREADMFICPSEREGMPNTVLEAMASGLPVVMKESCQGAKELIQGNGVLTRGDFCAGISELIASGRDEARRMGRLSRARAENEFSLDKAVTRYESLLRELTPGRRNIALFVGKLAGGGAERMVSRLSMALSDHYNVFVIVYSPDMIKYRAGGTVINAGGSSRFLRIRILHAAMHINRITKDNQIDLAISFLEVPNLINGLINRSCLRVVSMRTWQERAMMKTLSEKIRYRLFERAAKKSDVISTLTERQRQQAVEEFNIPADRVIVLENFFDVRTIREKSHRPVDEDKIRGFLGPRTAVTVGRLAAKKNTARLLRVFSLVRRKCPDARLLILGDGPLLPKLKKLSGDLRLRDSIMFAGNIKEPYPVIGKAALYVSLSENEGFPNALVEAMACAVPVMHTDCPTGPREILAVSDEDVPAVVRTHKQPVQDVTFTPCGVLLPVEGSGVDEMRRREEIAKCWLRLLEEQDLAERVAKAGAARAADFDVGVGRETYIHLINSLLEKM